MLEEEADDSKYKNFTTQVDKSLKGFEYSTEWADLISALGRLTKVIQGNARSNYIPRRSLIGKRLAQCLHPALPPGVHCKALECYDVIFRTVGPFRIALDLPIFGTGLFPLLGPSAMTVKPPLFNLFDEHLLPLGTSLRPAFTGLLQGLLPGLEPGAEFSERGTKTLEMFCSTVGSHFFYTCLWKVLICCPSLRHFGISFIIGHFNKRKSLDEQDFFYGLDRRILLCSLACLLNDSMVLVQRDALDFLQLALPIHLRADTYTKLADRLLSTSEWTSLCRSALGILLRRDASLNRRFFAWLMGGQLTEISFTYPPSLYTDHPVTVAYSVLHDHPNFKTQFLSHSTVSDDQAQKLYFNLYSRETLITAVRQVMSSPDCLPVQSQVIQLWRLHVTGLGSSTFDPAAERSIAERPLRILTGLLDRGDLGGSIIESLLSHVLWYIYSQYHNLKQRFIAWQNADSLAVIHGNRSALFGRYLPPSHNPVADDVLTMVNGYVCARSLVRPLSQRFDEGRLNKSPAAGTLLGASALNSESDGLSSAAESNTSDHSRLALTFAATRTTPADEFLRTAHMFLNNLDGDFFWGFIGSQFSLLLNSNGRSTTHSTSQSNSSFYTLEDLCHVVHLLLSHLPMDTHPCVCGHHLPRLTLHIINSLNLRIQAETTGDETSSSSHQLGTTQLSCVLSILSSIIEHISEYVLTMFDRSTVFSFTSSASVVTPMKSTEHSVSPLLCGSSTQDDLATVASAIGQFRHLFGTICVHIMGFSSEKLRQFFKSLRAPVSVADKPWTTAHAVNPTCDPKARWSLFSEGCSILLHMSNFPLLVYDAPESQSNLCNRLFEPCGLMELFNSDLVTSVSSDEETLPEWLLCLLFAAIETDAFDIKAVSMYTLLELFFASSSVHGCHSGSAKPPEKSTTELIPPSEPIGTSVQSRKMRLLLPVLSGRLLSFVNHKTNAFSRLGMSLWSYLDPRKSSFHEDTVNLLARLNQLFPSAMQSSSEPVKSTSKTADGFSLESFILSQMLSTDLKTRVDAHERFIVLWDLLRPSVFNVAQTVYSRSVDAPHIETKLSSFKSIAARSWLRPLPRFGSQMKTTDACSYHAVGLQGIPFHRCVLLLLDHLDFDTPWGPIGVSNTGGSDLHGSVCPPGSSAHFSESQTAGLLQSMLRELSLQWLNRSLRTRQVDRLMAPLLAALLHPATLRISLKALILQQHQCLHRRMDDSQSVSPKAFKAHKVADFQFPSELPNSSAESTLSIETKPFDSTEPKEDTTGVDCETTRLNFAPFFLRNDDCGLQLKMREWPPTMLPLHEHLVIHLQNHDVNQVVYALSRLRAILSNAPDLFVSSLISCAVTPGAMNDPSTSPYLFGLSLAELLTRHRIALVGGNFYGPLSPGDITHTVDTQPTLIEVVINLCLLIMCSQLPCINDTPRSKPLSTFFTCGVRCSFTTNELHANKYAQKTAAEVLELIVKELAKIRRSAFSGPMFPSPGSNNDTRATESKEVFDNAATSSTSGRRMVETILQRTCLTSAVLHCLANAVEIAHWPEDASAWCFVLVPENAASLPCCLQLLLLNQIACDLPSSFHSAHLHSLIRLTQAILELHPWSADRIEATPPRTIMSNTIWPFRPAYKDAVEVTDKIHTEFATVDNTCINLDTNELLVNIWLDAFAHLPPPLTSEPIFRTTCLNMHWDCESTQSSHPSREQGALLLDILTLALIPPRSISESNISLLRSRCDLQPLWFRFMFSTLSLWGLYTPHFVRAFVTHVCSNLFALVDGVAHGHGHQSDSNNLPWKATSGGKSEDYSSHPNYMLSCLACLQGIYHALLLPGGTAASVFRTRKHLSLVHDRSLGVTASSLTGLPEIISNATEFSELVSSIRCQTDSDSILFTIESSSGVPPCFNSPWNEPDFRLYESTSSNPAVHPAPAEPSVVLTPKPSIVFGNSKHDAQNFAAIFTTRTKRLFDSNGSSDAHPLLQAQTELFRLLPTVLCSLAELWDAFNQSPMGFVHPSDTVSSKDVWPSSRSVSIEQLPFLTALGTSALARPALRMLLQPIALLHPAPFLISMALSWPANLYDENESALSFNRAGTPKEHSVMSLLTPYLSPASGNKEAYTLPLLAKQSSLLRLLSGYTSDGTDFGLILPSSILTTNLRNIIKRPSVGVASVARSTQGSSTRDSASTSSSEPGTCAQALSLLRNRLQTNLLHIFYALIVYQPQCVSNDLILDLLRDLICLPITSPADSVQGVVGTDTSLISLPTVAVFLLVKIFHVFINRFTITDDKREQRELQELCHRLLESAATIAASALKQPTWFRRTLQVQRNDNTSDEGARTIPTFASSSTFAQPRCEDDQADTTFTPPVGRSTCPRSHSAVLLNSEITTARLSPPCAPAETNCEGGVCLVSLSSTSSHLINCDTSVIIQLRISDSQIAVDSCGLSRTILQNDMAVQAINLLTEHMVNFLDVIYRSDEKDRIPTFLTNILVNIFPYLRVRIVSNDDRFTAASRLLSSVSSYQYTRRAWRREVLDLLFEPAFFQMNPIALQSWNIIIDNLMTQDKATFREVLTRLTFSQPSSLSLFSNKETECDLRAACLKKLSYVLFASEPDQYAKAMPDLLERLTDCLRLSQGLVPQVHSQVFVFARVLIARMSSVQLTSLWPIIIPELILVFKSLSRCLQNRSTGARNQQKRHTEPNPKEFAMYLSACKLLATGFLTPEHKTPQFSFYQWVFSEEISNVNLQLDALSCDKKSLDSDMPHFIPLITEIIESFQSSEFANSLRSIPETSDNREQACLRILALKQLTHFSQLIPLLHAVNNRGTTDCDNRDRPTSFAYSNLITELALEAALAQEFPEPIATR